MTAFRVSQSIVDAHRAYQLVTSLENFYPDFSNWYWNKAVPSAVLGEGVMVLAERNHDVVGVALARKGQAAKLRCLRVHPQHAGRGIGLHLMDHTLRAMDCDLPPCTVPQELMHDFARMFVNRFGFSLDHVDRGLYRQGILEYQFNSTEDQRLKSAY